MEFISAEEFKKQPMEVQQVILNWWKPAKWDLFVNDSIGRFGIVVGEKKFKNRLIPLLTEGQLRKFIEDKTGQIVNLDYICKECGYAVVLTEGGKRSKPFIDLGEDVLQAYWKVAIEIAKREAR